MTREEIEELKDLYERDEDFRRYVDKWAQSRNLTVEEALQMRILQNYGRYIFEEKSGIVDNNGSR